MDICSKMTEAQWNEARKATWMPRMLPASWTKRLGKPSCGAGPGCGAGRVRAGLGEAGETHEAEPRGATPLALNFSHLISPSVIESFSWAMRFARSAISGQ